MLGELVRLSGSHTDTFYNLIGKTPGIDLIGVLKLSKAIKKLASHHWRPTGYKGSVSNGPPIREKGYCQSFYSLMISLGNLDEWVGAIRPNWNTFSEMKFFDLSDDS